MGNGAGGALRERLNAFAAARADTLALLAPLSQAQLDFAPRPGRWSIGEVARVDPGYLEWLEVHREGAPYVDEIDETLVRVGYRTTPRRPKPKQTARKRWGRR